MLKQRFERINELSKINSSKTYLEIGVNKGQTFNRIAIPFKVAVDPEFRFNTDEHKSDSVAFYEITSDEFFTKYRDKYESFDFIYLDGLHTFEQTFRDFCVSLNFANENTIWLIDDTCPTSLAAADPDQLRANKLKKIIGGERDASWMGDVYKLIFALHDFFPQFSYATFNNHGQTAIWRSMRTNFKPLWNSWPKVGLIGYDDFLEHRDAIFNINEPDEIIEMINKQLISHKT